MKAISVVIRRLMCSFVLLLGSSPLVGAEPTASAAFGDGADHSKAVAEHLENLGLLYSNKDNAFVQEVWTLGRYHGQYHWSDGPSDREDSYENRRFRLGGQVKFFNRLTLHAQMVSAPDMIEFYGGFTELWTQWEFNNALDLTIGQQKHRFTHDRNVSSRYLNYLERGMLTNMFALDYTPAVTLSGTIGRWNYYTGIFSNATGTDMEMAFTELNSGWSALASVTYDLRNALGTDSAFMTLGYLHSDANERATHMNRFENSVSGALIVTKGPASLVTELLAGFGGERSDAAGINIQPGVYLTDKLQFVARYQAAFSYHEDGLRAQRRYERNVGLNRGELYQSAYAGLNYYIAGHRLKLMSGIEYSRLDNLESWTASVALRLFWGPHSKGPFPMAQNLKGIW